MPDGKVILIAAAIAAGIWAGQKTYTHVLKPVGCGVTKVVTLGHKHCGAKKPAQAKVAQSK